jgi:hypothetical protein
MLMPMEIHRLMPTPPSKTHKMMCLCVFESNLVELGCVELSFAFKLCHEFELCYLGCDLEILVPFIVLLFWFVWFVDHCWLWNLFAPPPAQHFSVSGGGWGRFLSLPHDTFYGVASLVEYKRTPPAKRDAVRCKAILGRPDITLPLKLLLEPC